MDPIELGLRELLKALEILQKAVYGKMDGQTVRFIEITSCVLWGGCPALKQQKLQVYSRISLTITVLYHPSLRDSKTKSQKCDARSAVEIGQWPHKE